MGTCSPSSSIILSMGNSSPALLSSFPMAAPVDFGDFIKGERGSMARKKRRLTNISDFKKRSAWIWRGEVLL
ncbi:hypothetical protein U9M48_002596 [Paspalum notatum var. saurae]|uniref:Uncharacterized protein n=1 Tax=Paspalum notatum var. saurae TaxID=547442 RepID=A0AAQ3SJ69_PASNO